jgi:hypothetical protein
LTSPFYNIFTQQGLGLLTPDEWQALVKNNMDVDAPALEFLDQVAGGHPFFVQMAAGHLWDVRAKGEVDYDQLRQELWFQFQPHLQYLWRKLSPDEQAVLTKIATSDSADVDPIRIAALERRGIVRQRQPFSRLFSEMIVGRHLA